MNKWINFIAKVVLALLIVVLCSFQAQPAAETDKQEELLFVAQKALEDGFYDVSFGYLEQFLKDYPDTEKRHQVYLLMGQCYLYQGRHLEAIDTFDNILTLFGIEDIKDAIYYWKAEVYFKVKDYAQAKNFYKEVITNFPDSKYSADSIYSLGWCLLEERKYLEAIKEFERLVQLYPGHELTEESYFKVSEALYNQKDYQEAEKSFSSFVEKFPKSKRIDQAYFYKAESNYYLGRYVKAIEEYKKVSESTKSDKLSVLSKTGIGWSHLLLKKLSEAEQSFKEAEAIAREKNIGLDSVLLGEASLLSELNKDKESRSKYEELISDFSDSSLIWDAYLGRATILYKQEKYAEALEAYDDLVNELSWQEEFSDLLEKVYFGMAWTNLKLGRTKEAIKEFQDIINRTQERIVKINALSQLADLYQNTGQSQEAVGIYDRLLKDFPDNLYSDYIQYQLAITLLKMDNHDAAILALQSLNLNYPESKFNLDSEYYLSLAYFNKGDFITAKEQLQSFVDKIGRDNQLRPQATQLLGLIYRQLKEYKESANIFERMSKEYSADIEISRIAEYEFAISLHYLGKDKESLKKLKLLTYKYPNTKIAEDSLYYIADYYLKKGEFETARRYFYKIIDEYPEAELIDAVYYAIAESFFQEKRFDEATKNFDIIMAKPYSKFFGPASLALADIQAENKDLDLAVKMCRKLAAEHSEFAREAFIRIGNYYEDLSKYENSIKAYQEAIDKPQGISDLDEAQIHFKIAELLEEKNDLDKAVEAYLKVAYLSSGDNPVVIKSYLRAARIFEDKESWQEAKKIYEKIASEDVEEAKFAKERLEWIAININN
ncbi:MAG: tetratricopeptide repeat protein [Candidatus Omnitrophota bacterium]